MKTVIGLTLIILTSIIVFGPSKVSADPVYKWKDSSGVTHYQTRPMYKDAKPAELPPIMRGDVKLAKGDLITCHDHGGVDCEAGTDSDGSVVCRDGFKEAISRFRFECLSPRLLISEISELLPDGGFSVVVRNSKSVKADDAKVVYKRENFPELSLTGPTSIEPLGSGEYLYKPKEGDPLMSEKPTVAEVSVNCLNCPK